MTTLRKNECGLLAGIGLVAIFGSFAGCGGSGGDPFAVPYRSSISNAVALDTGILMYANDYDDGLPLPGAWMATTLPYVKNSSLYRSPLVASRGYGYAFNSTVAGMYMTQFSSPSTTISIFDSTDLTYNATDPTTTLPAPPRYGTWNTIAYLDGHVQNQVLTTNPPTPFETSITRMKRLAIGGILYANDYDDIEPLANKWMDGLTPYVKDPIDFRSPAVVSANPNGYGYALNSAVAGVQLSSVDAPAMTLFIFDSTDVTYNATDLTSTLPNPPRYGANNTLSYLDGHVPNPQIAHAP